MSHKILFYLIYFWNYYYWLWALIKDTNLLYYNIPHRTTEKLKNISGRDTSICAYILWNNVHCKNKAIKNNPSQANFSCRFYINPGIVSIIGTVNKNTNMNNDMQSITLHIDNYAAKLRILLHYLYIESPSNATCILGKTIRFTCVVWLCFVWLSLSACPTK